MPWNIFSPASSWNIIKCSPRCLIQYSCTMHNVSMLLCQLYYYFIYNIIDASHHIYISTNLHFTPDELWFEHKTEDSYNLSIFFSEILFSIALFKPELRLIVLKPYMWPIWRSTEAFWQWNKCRAKHLILRWRPTS